ncbi:hypothetical protein [Bradyrhizobium valentinum]|uniref:hypothetical protein n=1 Tax=Bradyrhizobium valentinum TaxID=1518501 RepID=UPI0012E347A4|nr:hypothetical protein [Bradyrhizobium valentinum]
MSKSGTNWTRAKRKPTRPAYVNFPLDHLGISAKRAFREWKQSLTQKQRRSLAASR